MNITGTSPMCLSSLQHDTNRRMNPIRKKRQSCEACRARKLKCSGEQGGCSRCLALSLTCDFQDKGAPGRPRKRAAHQQACMSKETQKSPRNEGQSQQPDLQHQQSTQQDDSTYTPSNDDPTSVPSEPSPALPPGLMDSLMDYGGHGPGHFPFDLASNLSDSTHVPSDLMAPGDTIGTYALEPPELSDTWVSTARPASSCDCTRNVFKTTRNLRSNSVTHDTVRNLRMGIDLAERLLTCPICYDVSKPGRVTIENVLLLGRLILELTSGYLRYLKWLKESCGDLIERDESEMVYLMPGLEAGWVLSFKISGEKFQDLITHGLQADAERLSNVGAKFAIRQHNRHIAGHEACPNAEGRCWREDFGFIDDPMEVCPQNAAANLLTPCFRIVNEVRASIKQVAEAVGRAQPPISDHHNLATSSFTQAGSQTSVCGRGKG